MKIYGVLICIVLITGCVGNKKIVRKKTETLLSQRFFDNQFTGLLVIDAYDKDTLYKKNHRKYFIPASNTKIATLYTSLKMLPDSIPALKYVQKNDTLFMEGTGDPTLLHSHFKSTKTLGFLKKNKNIAFAPNNFREEKSGPGWAWEDYDLYYQPERSAFPIYGNVVTVYKNKNTPIRPPYFAENLVKRPSDKIREEDENIFYYQPTAKDTLEIPFKTGTPLFKKLLENVLGKKIHITPEMPNEKKSTLYSLPTDTVLRRMMQKSDNFLAEQLMIMASSTLSDTLSISKAQDYMLDNHFADIGQEPRWVDGSGLSRYNLFTPESLVRILEKLHTEIPEDRLFGFFNAYKKLVKNEKTHDLPFYIHAKSGSMGNTYNLSGYLITKSGKTLIFSFMNNHYRQPAIQIKKRVQQVLELLRLRY